MAAGQAAVQNPGPNSVAPDSHTATTVPALVTFSGTVRDNNGQALRGVVGLVFSIYKDQAGGAPLWQEIQNVQLDEQGRYIVFLGGATNGGLPVDLFTASESRWLGVQTETPGGEEQPRLLIGSVPYAIKAIDADTLGGRPASAFITVQSDSHNKASASKQSDTKNPDNPTSFAVDGTGTSNKLVKWTATDTIGDSAITEVAGNLGIGTPNPVTLLHVKAPSAQTRIESTGAGAGNYALQSYAANGAIKFNFGLDGDLGSNKLSIYDASVGKYTTTWADGNLGIGTTSPLTQLHVKAPSAQLRMESSGAGAGNYAIESYAANGAIKFNVGLDGDLSSNKFSIYDATVGTYATTWSGGNVGIGTTNPLTLLHVKAANAQARIESNSAGPGNYAMQSYAAGGSTKFNVGLDGDLGSNKLAIYDITAGTYSTVWSDGNVGIGTPTPTAKLEVAGSLKISGGGNGVAFADGSSLTSANPVIAARIRAITYLAGCDSCSSLQATDDQKMIYVNVVGAMTINDIKCYSDAGGPTINLHRNGTTNNILNTNLTCSTTGGVPGPTIVPAESVLSLNDTLDFEMVTVDNMAKRLTVVIKTIVN